MTLPAFPITKASFHISIKNMGKEITVAAKVRKAFQELPLSISIRLMGVLSVNEHVHQPFSCEGACSRGNKGAAVGSRVQNLLILLGCSSNPLAPRMVGQGLLKNRNGIYETRRVPSHVKATKDGGE